MITLLTDFGLQDHYVGAMKGVVLSISPSVQIVDISHEITPYAIRQGAYVLDQCWRDFPPGTIHVAVVDPGVGTTRRGLLVESAGHYFVGPDNGIFACAFAGGGVARVIENQEFFRLPVSRTFHGRDIFAPVAAHLARGTAAENFGPLTEEYYFDKTILGEYVLDGGQYKGTILHKDRFGNLITSFQSKDFPWVENERFALRVGRATVDRFSETYETTSLTGPFVIAGSSGRLEVSITRASAADVLSAVPGDFVTMTHVVS